MICKACSRIDRFDFHVPDRVWRAVVPPALRNRVVCLNCFDAYAREVNVTYAKHVRTLYSAGNKAAMTFRLASATDIDESSY